jgi:hypothetical protein
LQFPREGRLDGAPVSRLHLLHEIKEPVTVPVLPDLILQEPFALFATVPDSAGKPIAHASGRSLFPSGDGIIFVTLHLRLGHLEDLGRRFRESSPRSIPRQRRSAI